ncbi:Exoglucanase B precursor [compost metagenome]
MDLKKGLFIVVLCFSLLMPVNSVFAANESIIGLDNYIWYKSTAADDYKKISTSSIFNSSILSDGNSNTFQELRGYGNIRNIWTEFTVPADITGFKLKASPVAGIPQVYIKFYDLSGNIIYTSSNLLISGSNNVKINVDLKNVGGLSITSGFSNSSNYANIEELELYGDSKIVTPDPPSKFVFNDVRFMKVSNNSFSVNWSPVESQQVRKYKLYLDGVLKSETNDLFYLFDKVDPTKMFNVKIGVVDYFGNEYFSDEYSYSFPPPDTTPPDKPIGLKVESDIYKSVLHWTFGNEEDLVGYWIYLNNQKVNTSFIKNDNFTLNSLTPETDYSVYIVAIDLSGNISEPSSVVTFKTKAIMKAPENAPILYGYVGNGTANLNWNAVQYADRYEVYQDDEMIAETNATRLNLKKLKNSQTYDFYVVATNDIGSSSPSNVLSLTPSEKLIPDIAFGYSLKDVSNGVSSWFSSFWLILAFCIAIPLAFYIGNRVKGLFAN